ncbi:hypothetical protein AAHA92_00157 [Salvia divinorum]|uniref:Zinc finger GRF-type domain-containing protein n=1 Tax=Salvia divinorum TaxID=28513 RepID=A0ABD1ILT2_SALDI
MKSQEVHDQYNAPQCRCGQGNMVVGCGRKIANHPGCYYYKCPLNSKYAQSFIWCDEFQASNPTIENQVSSVSHLFIQGVVLIYFRPQ